MFWFIEELKRRNVLRAAAFYAAAGWLIVQIATQVFPFFDIPNWAVRLVVVAVVAGFPFALVISWFFELTPTGLARDPNRAWRPHLFQLALLSAASLAAVVLIAATTTARRSSHDTSPATAATASIAVLPFRNLSSSPENAYFADGIQGEILTRLAHIGSLKVTSSTSTARYSSAPADLPKIAAELGVDNILEGSVQRQGDDVRINVQLIKAREDANIWAETYDRLLIDIFGVESEVARSVAQSLQARLTGKEQKALDAAPTANPEAYDQYLRGVAFDLRSFEPANLRRAGDALRRAVTLDPAFALAWARLARVDASLGYQGSDADGKSCDRSGVEAAKALELEPELGEALLAQGTWLYLCKNDLDRALAALDRARVVLPGSAEVLETMGSVEHRRGEWGRSVEYMRQAMMLDPRNPKLLGSYALTLAQMRRFKEARALADKALEVTPDDPSKLALQIYSWQAEGDLDRAGKLLDAVAGHVQEVDVFDYQVLQLLYQRQYPQAIDKLRQALAQDLGGVGEGAGDYYYLLGVALRGAGDTEGARKTFADGQRYLARFASSAQSADTDTYLHALLCLMAAGQAVDPEQDGECAITAKAAASTGAYAPSAREALARAQALRGNANAAIAPLSELLHTPYYSFLYSAPLTRALLRLDPVWDSVRNDERFKNLMVESPAANGQG
jgi:TolB-like protein/Flp pilus assembly protein TadD